MLPSHVMLYPQPLCTDLPWNVFHFLFLAISPTEHMDVCASVCLHAGVGSSRKRWFVLHLNTRELCYYAKAFCPPHQPGPKGQRPSCHASTLYICPIPTHLLYIYAPSIPTHLLYIYAHASTLYIYAPSPRINSWHHTAFLLGNNAYGCCNAI